MTQNAVHAQLARLRDAFDRPRRRAFRDLKVVDPVLGAALATAAAAIASVGALGALHAALVAPDQALIFAIALFLAVAFEYGARRIRRTLVAEALGAQQTLALNAAFRTLLSDSPEPRADLGRRLARFGAIRRSALLLSGREGEGTLDLLAAPILLLGLVWIAGPLAAPIAVMVALSLAAALVLLRQSAPRRLHAAQRLKSALADWRAKERTLTELRAQRAFGERIATLAVDAARERAEERARASLPRAGAALAATAALLAMLALWAWADAGLAALVAAFIGAARLGSSAATALAAAPALHAALHPLRTPRQPAEADIEARPVRLEGAVAVRGLQVRRGDKLALRRFSLDIAVGEIVALCGPSGGGKSTLLETIAGLRPVESGLILMDGRDLATLDPHSLRAQTAYLPARASLFVGDVADNLRLLAPGATPDLMFESLARAGVTPTLLPQGLGTRVGPGVSGALTVKILLAGLYAKQPSLLLLDEPGAFLDREGDEALLAQIARLRGRTSVLLVTNRPSHLRACDRIIRLEDGMIAIDGPTQRVLSA